MKLDVLAIGAHPDDVELACGGTIIKLLKQGRKVGLADLTEGELGTRGSRKIRAAEALEAARILGLALRENLQIPDGNIQLSKENLLKVISLIRQFKPALVSNQHDPRSGQPRVGPEVSRQSNRGGAKLMAAQHQKID